MSKLKSSNLSPSSVPFHFIFLTARLKFNKYDTRNDERKMKISIYIYSYMNTTNYKKPTEAGNPSINP